ncbi:hypothetical protein KEM55_005623 [Ascosphaera atra]|nr:hypothetical protein KEM55_005623 [Ascosphaera atra]
MNERVVQAFDKGTGAFRHGQTYQGHAVGCAAALAVQRIVQRENLLENVRAMGKLLEKRLREKLSGHPNVGDIRGKGLFWGVELVRDKATKETFPPKYGLASRIQLAAMGPEYSFQIYSGSGTADGVNGDHVLLAPPYTVTAEEIEIVAELTLRVITDVTKEVKDELEG